MNGTGRKQHADGPSDARARVLCYLLGALSGAFLLQFRNYSGAWSVRFHAFHSIFLTAVWGAGWAALRAIEGISPSWFLGALFHEIRFAFNLGFIVVWLCLLATAYRGIRCAVIPPVHSFAVRMARRTLQPIRR
jgi:uncharacterized membrane protein